MNALLKDVANDCRMWLGIGTLLFALGVLSCMTSFSWKTRLEPEAEPAQQDKHEESRVHFDFYRGWLTFGATLVVLGALAGSVGFIQLIRQPLSVTEPARSKILYSRHLVGIGYALLLVGLSNGILLSGMTKTSLLHAPDASLHEHSTNAAPADASHDKLAALLPKTHPKHDPVVNALLVLLSIGMGLLGALFFVANSLRRKRVKCEPFDVGVFWGGLWYRLGEAVLFTLVCFWLIWTYQWADGPCWLPIIGLALGMFVTSGERLVYGFGRRLFRAAEEFFPFTSGASELDGETSKQTMSGLDANKKTAAYVVADTSTTTPPHQRTH